MKKTFFEEERNSLRSDLYKHAVKAGILFSISVFTLMKSVKHVYLSGANGGAETLLKGMESVMEEED